MYLRYNSIAFWSVGLIAAIIMPTACDSNLQHALDMAGDNRAEMERVLEYFKYDSDPLKYEAAKYLIENMPYHFSYYGEAIERYDSIYSIMAEYPVQKRDSVFATLVSGIDFSGCKAIPDIQSLDADYLINLIDDACEAWENNPWSKEYDKSYFFDYVLPYRVTYERPSDWRTTVSKEYPYLKLAYTVSRRGPKIEAEDGLLHGCRVETLFGASNEKVAVLDSGTYVTFKLSSPLSSKKLLRLTYSSESRHPEIGVTLNGDYIGKYRLDPTVTMQSLRDSKAMIEANLLADENIITISCSKGTIAIDKILLSSLEPYQTHASDDYTDYLYRIKNEGSGNYVTFDTLRESLLNLAKLKPMYDRTDSCSMLRLDFKGECCWSVSSFKRDSIDLCLESRYCSTEENAPVSQYHWLNGAHQKWIFIPVGNGLYRIMGKDNGLFLESVKDENGNEIMIQTQYAGRKNQKWRMEKCGVNPAPNPRYRFGSVPAAAMKVFDYTPQFEWMEYKGSIPPKTSSLIEGKTGNCLNESTFAVSLCRHVGIPVAVDFTPNYANRSQGHSWSVLINPDGTSTLFHMGFAPGDSVYFVKNFIRPKVFRHNFRLNRVIMETLRHENEIPRLFRNADFIDVTEEYGPVTDVTRSVPNDVDGKVAYICVFDNKEWVPVHYGMIKYDKVTFRSMGRNVVYIAATYRDGKIVPFGNPFLVDVDGDVRDIASDETKYGDMTLLRKYPFMSYKDEVNRRLNKGEFQASDNAAFSNAVVLYTHTGLTDGNWYDILTDNKEKHLFARYVGPAGSYCNINEIEFISPEGKKIIGEIIGTQGKFGKEREKVFDGDILTGFEGNSMDGHWVGLKFRKPETIGRIRYIPRNDGNGIEVGDEYELFYWNENRWKSLGRKKAEENYLNFENVPSGELYLLRDLTKGKEERIFTYEDGKQIWW